MDKYWYWITNTEGVGRCRIDQLLEHYGSAQNVFCADEDELKKSLIRSGISQDLCDKFIASKKSAGICYEKFMEDNFRLDIKCVSVDDEKYPQKLRNIPKPPYILYYRGRLPDMGRPAISVVGARKSDEYGMQMARVMSRRLAENGVQVISGMAMGIDKSAHEGALLGGDTYAVLGCGVDICYPKINIDLYMQILDNGGIISEYPPGSKALKHHFPERNRIISGLSDGVLVAQARQRSGSLITVEHALEQGKNIYAFPGRVTDELSEGCLELIKEGAKCVTSPEDILEDLKMNKRNAISNFNGNLTENFLETTEKIVYANLRLDSKHIEEVRNETGISLPEIMEALVGLQMKKLVKQTAINRYARNIL